PCIYIRIYRRQAEHKKHKKMRTFLCLLYCVPFPFFQARRAMISRPVVIGPQAEVRVSATSSRSATVKDTEHRKSTLPSVVPFRLSATRKVRSSSHAPPAVLLEPGPGPTFLKRYPPLDTACTTVVLPSMVR